MIGGAEAIYFKIERGLGDLDDCGAGRCLQELADRFLPSVALVAGFLLRLDVLALEAFVRPLLTVLTIFFERLSK